MRHTVIRIIIIALCVAVISGFIYIDNKDAVNVEESEISFYLNKEVIRAWKKDGTYYLFLPSYANVEEVRLTSYSDEFILEDLGVLMKRGDTLPELTWNEKIKCEKLSKKEDFSLYVMKSENLPALFLDTDSGSIEAIWSDKNIEENGKIRLVDVDGTVLYAGGLNSIKARGNYSFSNYNKKPFSITTKEAVSLLGLGTGQKYALLSNASDPTLIRNDIARRMEQALYTEYDNVGRFLDLYVNGEYLGNYYLCENIEVGYDRINITNLEEQMELLYGKANYEAYPLYETDTKRAREMEMNPADITGGYLVEREFADRYRLEYLENPSGFITDSKEHFVVTSPRYCSVEQIEYLQRFFCEAEEAILEEDGNYQDYIDVDSFVKKYLLEETIKNYDGGVSSMFFYKDSDAVDGRIKAAPIWDADMSLGNYLEWMEFFSADPRGITRLSVHDNGTEWFKALYEREEFYDSVCRYYKEILAPYMEDLTSRTLDEYEMMLQASSAMNEIRWQDDYLNNSYYTDQKTSYHKLREYIKDRKQFLDLAWIEQIPYCMVVYKNKENGSIYAIDYVESGEKIEVFPDIKEDAFNGWDYSGECITEDTVITGK